MAFAIANALLLLAAVGVLAAPVDDVDSDLSVSVDSVDAASLPVAITAISNSQVDSYTPFTHYAAAGYCNPSVTEAWTCGANCDANPGFKPIASGGDGSSTQFCTYEVSETGLWGLVNIDLIRVRRLRPNAPDDHRRPSRN